MNGLSEEPAAEHRASDPRWASAELADFGLTVAECLAISPLTKASVCGGQAGLARRARWVHVIDHDDIEDSLTGSELILASGVSLGHDLTLQRAIFPIMERRSSAGLILSIGSYIPQVPEAMIRDAEHFGIPLIAMPWEVNFRDVTQVLLTRIVRHQYRLLENAEAINRSLLQMALNRGTLDLLCEQLSKSTGRGVAVVDPSFQVMASHPAHPRDVDFPGVFLPSQQRRKALKLEIETITTQEGRWAITAPIIISTRLQGYIILDTGLVKPERLEGMVLETATLVAALLIAQNDEIERIRASRERDSFLALLEGSQDSTKIAAMGPIIPGPYNLMVFAPAGGAVESDRRLVRRALENFGSGVRITEYAEQIIALVAPSRRHSPRSIAEAMLDRFDGGHSLCRIGLSLPFKSLSEVRDAYTEAVEAIVVGRALDPDARVLIAEDTTALRQFVRSLGGSETTGYGRIQLLADHDATRGSELVRTLECLLESNQNAAVAARKLSIHRHTLAYRLDRIADLLGVPLTPDRSLDLRLQLLAFRLAGSRSR